MASRIIHLVISKKLLHEIDIKRSNRFRIGSILPDAIVKTKQNHAYTHYKINIDDDTKKMMDFDLYYKQFKEQRENDELYLGYLFYLISDGIYRAYIERIKFERTDESKSELHNDYTILNRYLIDKYSLYNDLLLPEEFQNEQINRIYPFKGTEILNELSCDFDLVAKGSTIHLTENLIEKYIDEAVAYCNDVYISMSKSDFLLNPREFAWIRNK